jgi:hypothetical protein
MSGSGTQTAAIGVGGKTFLIHIIIMLKNIMAQLGQQEQLTQQQSNKLLEQDLLPMHYFSGNVPPNSVTSTGSGYDGTAWSTRPTMGTARQAGAYIAGTSGSGSSYDSWC